MAITLDWLTRTGYVYGMPVITQKFITRADLKANPDRLYLFGDNEARVGTGGQAREMRGEPNAVGICTKRTPGTVEIAYWNDDEVARITPIIDADFMPVFQRLLNEPDLIVVVPEDGLGTGLAELATRAPQTLTYINEWISILKMTKLVQPNLDGAEKVAE